MKTSIFKKIISLTSLIFILFVFLIPIHFSLADIVCNPPLVPSSDFTSCVTPTTPTTDNSYHLLQPIGNGMSPTFNPGDKNALGVYINAMIKIFIGICSVLAVIMIVMGGIEYMTSELISSKESGAEKIKGAVFGLILALGAWTILNQINPKLLDADLTSLTSQTVNVTLQTDLDSAPPTVTKFTGSIPSGSVAACTTGVTQSSTTGIVACSSVSANVDSLVAAAQAAGLTISAGGFRTNTQQTALRVQNCNGNTTDASATCNPPTALPGHSEHESGLAFDMTCSGTTIQASDNACFKWLQANAATYGLHNLPSEPWHWSIDGH